MSNCLQTLLFLCAVFARALPAQMPTVERITIADGLSQGMIYDILQDRDGFLWFATKDGLNRYDGYRFEVFTNDPFDPFSIAGNDIHRMFEDSHGNLWLSIGGVGVDVLEHATGRFLHLPGAENAAVSFEETPDGSIWLGAKQLLRLDWKNSAATASDSPDLRARMDTEKMSDGAEPVDGDFLGICAQTDGTLLTSIWGSGVFRFDPANRQFTKILPTQLPAYLYKTGPNRVWSCSEKQIFIIEDGKPREIFFNKNFGQPSFVRPDGEGNMVYAMYIGIKRSIFFEANESEILASGRLPLDRPILNTGMLSPSAEIDRAGNLWAGTSGYGLHKLRLVRQPFEHLLHGQSVNRIANGLKNYIFPATNDNLGLFDAVANTVRPVQNLPTGRQFVHGFQVKNGTEYFVSNDIQGSYFYIGSPQGERLQLEGSWSTHIPFVEDSEGNIWLGKGSKPFVYCYRPGEKKLLRFSLLQVLGEEVPINALHVDPQKNFWVGTEKGIAMWDADRPLSEATSRQATVFQTNSADPHSLRHNFVSSFADDPLEPDRFLWVSTKGGGLNLLNKNTGEFQHFTSQNSDLPNDVVYGILTDDTGKLWMSTNRGLSRLTIELGKKTGIRNYRFRNFREPDGLQGDEFNTAAFGRAADGRLFFGGVNGLTTFYPSKIRERTSSAAARITGLKINNLYADRREPGGVLRLPEKIELRHDQNLVTLEFALMDFSNPQENRFRYRLLGVEKDWVEAGTGHSANYAQLRPGVYTFEVQGGLGNGVWNEQTARLDITVMPPWWATWWAYLLYFLLAGGALFTFYKNRLRQKLEHAEAERLKSLDEFKNRFFTNITHEFRTPLTVILGMADQLEIQPPGQPSNHLQLIKRNGENLLRLINQILDLAKLESNSLKINYVQGDVLAYLRYIAESLHSLANAQNLMLRVESDQAKIVMDYDPERLLQVVHNFLSNAIKFSPDGGTVTMRLYFKNKWLTIEVADEGPGIPLEDQGKIFDRFFQAKNKSNSTTEGSGIGLALTRELVLAMDGELYFECPPSGGTVFFVHLPVTNRGVFEEPNFGREPKTIGLEKAGAGAAPGGLDTGPLVLLIEDNPDVVEYLTACLSGNYRLIFAYNGRSGIEKALETVPDLIILDVMMPEKDGFEVCDFLKNDERTSHIPVVLLTAKADVESRLTGLRRRADVYLAKPFHQEELLVQVQNLLETRQKLRERYASPDFGFNTSNGMPDPETEAQHPKPENLEDAFFKKFRGVLEANFADPEFSLEVICRELAMSRTQVYRKLMALTGRSAIEHIQSFRLEKSRSLLQAGGLNVSEVAFQTGFNDPKYFSRVFSEHFGQPPSELIGRR